MTEEWRIKRYYDKRVLIGVSDTLETTYDAVLVCLEASELNILRNLMQYAHRRANWVSEYHQNYYLCPSETEWDSIEAIVAELEGKLMSCETFTTLLTDILAQMQCVCDRVSQTERITPGIQPIIQGYLDDELLSDADVWADEQTDDTDRCAVAQLVFATAWEILTEILQPTQNVMIDVLMPSAMVLLATLCGATILLIPTGLFLALLWQLIEVWVAGALENVQNAYQTYKDELICAVYDGLPYSYRQAETNAVEVIDGISALSPIDKILLHCCFAPWMIHLAQTAWDNQTDWAVATVVEDYCDDCAKVLTGTDVYVIWPPCPGDYFTDGGVCYDTYLSFNGDVTPATQLFIVDDGSYNELDLWAAWYSRFGSGFTVGAVYLDKWSGALWDWVQQGAMSLNNTQSAGNMNNDSAIYPQDPELTGGLYRIRLAGAAGQHETDPYPMEMQYVRVRLRSV